MPYRPSSNNDFHDLLESQKFEIREAIDNAGFQFSEFSYAVVESEKMYSTDVPVLRHNKSNSVFAFDFLKHEYSGEFLRFSTRRPGKETQLEILSPETWLEQLAQVREWLALIKRELNPADYKSSRQENAVPAASGLEQVNTNEIVLFISHSSEDTKLAEAFVELLKNALPIPPEKIRCTSVLAHSFPYGTDGVEQARLEVLSAPIVIGLITPSSTQSHWVLFELGARWGQRKPLFSILAGGAGVDLLPGPIRSDHALKDVTNPAVVKFVDELASHLDIKPSSSWKYSKYVDAFVTCSQEITCKAKSGGTTEGSSLSPLEAFKKRYHYEETVSWKYDESGKRDGPFCPNCVDEGKERRLNPGATKGTYSCTHHKSRFRTAEYDTTPSSPPRLKSDFS